jgi:hypothetical protein
MGMLTMISGFGLHAPKPAYEIVNKRAYHHGTVVISSGPGTLGKFILLNKVLSLSPLTQD